MSQDENSTQLDDKMSAQMFYHRGVDYFDQGDFLAARRDFTLAMQSSPSPELEEQAKAMLKRLRVDPFEVAAGVGVFLLLAALYIYFGLLA